ncbi:hypothetical protein [Tenacibaculum agarivorans]|uniref:hypothetical protein n=1 Tax=Tenacibaculum agarivorans TaxID=1908389 RepID=UPI00094B7D8A|nr:hypothetical protein [Tenacibaculum agarivorans]
MKKIYYLIFCFFSVFLFSQERLYENEVYEDENGIVRKESNNEIFSGYTEKVRRNGHLVRESKYDKGVLKFVNIYFNGKGKAISNKYIYGYYDGVFLSKEIKYGLPKNN